VALVHLSSTATHRRLHFSHALAVRAVSLVDLTLWVGQKIQPPWFSFTCCPSAPIDDHIDSHAVSSACSVDHESRRRRSASASRLGVFLHSMAVRTEHQRNIRNYILWGGSSFCSSKIGSSAGRPRAICVAHVCGPASRRVVVFLAHLHPTTNVACIATLMMTAAKKVFGYLRFWPSVNAFKITSITDGGLWWPRLHHAFIFQWLRISDRR
jgi:hypothetical protein